MNYGALTYRAAVDWVALQIKLSKRSNFMEVRDELRAALHLPDHEKLYVEALDEANGRSASLFRFRIQDPTQGRKLDQVVARLQQRFDLDSIQVVGIEVAFDTYSTGASVRELAEVAADRYRFLTTAPGDDWYFYRRAGEGRRYINDDTEIGQRRDLVKCFAEGWQLTDSNSQDAPVRFHAYVKTTDRGRDLLPNAYCARLEITLQGSALPCATVEKLKHFDFATLAKHFKFRRLADDLHPAARFALMTWTKQQLGRRGRYRRPHWNKIGTYSGTSKYRGSTVADDKLNDAAYECLRKLTRDWRSSRMRADFPEGFQREALAGQGNA